MSQKLTARAVAVGAASRARALVGPQLADPTMRREYVAARERGETVPLALFRARLELAAYRALSWVVDDLDGGPYNSPALDVYDVDPRELAAVTSDRRYAMLTGYTVDADGRPVLSPVTLPDGATARIYVYADGGATPDGDAHDGEPRDAYGVGDWRFVGVSAVVTLADGRQGESAVWGVEQGDYWPGSPEAQIWHVVPDQLADALSDAYTSMPDPANIPDDDRATCGTCGRSWNARTLPTPSTRCPWEAEHDDVDTCTVCGVTGAGMAVVGGQTRCEAHLDAPDGLDPDDDADAPDDDGVEPYPRQADDDDETPTANLAARMHALVDELTAARDDDPAEGYDQGFAMGLDEAIDCVREVLDAHDAATARDDDAPNPASSDAAALDAIQAVWSENLDDTTALRRIRDILAGTGRGE